MVDTDTSVGTQLDLFVANFPEEGNLRTTVEQALTSITRADIVSQHDG